MFARFRIHAFFACIMCCFFCANALARPITVFAPSKPYIEQLQPKEQRKQKRRQRPAPENEVDILMTIMRPEAYAGENMDLPQFFAALFYPENYEPGKTQAELINLLGDVEEIRYLNKKAWGANVSVDKPGLYQFILESKPWWDEKRQLYLHQQAKVALPVGKHAGGWAESFGQSFEILPLTRPFGLLVPALFSARLQLDGKPLENVAIHFGRINSDHAKTASYWHDRQECRTDAAGNFAFLLTKPGWWYCEASIAGAPLKGPKGEMSPVERSTVLWLYVDGKGDNR